MECVNQDVAGFVWKMGGGGGGGGSDGRDYRKY